MGTFAHEALKRASGFSRLKIIIFLSVILLFLIFLVRQHVAFGENTV